MSILRHPRIDFNPTGDLHVLPAQGKGIPVYPSGVSTETIRHKATPEGQTGTEQTHRGGCPREPYTRLRGIPEP